MSRRASWRIISDYTGAGEFVVGPDRVILGTGWGVQAVSREEGTPVLWSEDLGTRCLGVRELPGGELLATGRSGVFRFSPEGKVLAEHTFARELASEVLPLQDGYLALVGNHLQRHLDWQGPAAWTYDLREALGSSVESVRPIHLFRLDGSFVCGVVDYDSGIGRVIVIDPDGEVRWMSEPGPLSEVFPAGDDEFVWSLTGYGRFESHLTRTDGEERWNTRFAGVGSRRADGSLAMLVGSNEAPEWDHWEYRQITPGGKLEAELKGRGRVPVRPCCHEDGSVYFVGYVFHIDPSSSRVDYTNFFKMPQELVYQHLIGVRLQIPEYEVLLQRAGSQNGEVEVLYRISGSFSLVAPRLAGDEIVFCDGTDIVAVAR